MEISNHRLVLLLFGFLANTFYLYNFCGSSKVRVSRQRFANDQTTPIGKQIFLVFTSIAISRSLGTFAVT